MFLALVAITNLINNTFTRYESTVDLSAAATTAFFVIDQGTYEGSISLTDLEPSTVPIYHTFYVANYNTDNKRTNVNLRYTISFETTTNLPLSYEIIRNESFSGTHHNLIETTTTRTDENGVYYYVFGNDDSFTFNHNQNQLDEYTIKVVFPESYKNYPDLYQGAIELFTVKIHAEQIT
jgi:hypothetical protein